MQSNWFRPSTFTIPKTPFPLTITLFNDWLLIPKHKTASKQNRSVRSVIQTRSRTKRLAFERNLQRKVSHSNIRSSFFPLMFPESNNRGGFRIKSGNENYSNTDFSLLELIKKWKWIQEKKIQFGNDEFKAGVN